MHTGFTTTGLNYKGKLQGTQRHRGHEEIKQTIVLGLRCRNKDRYRNLVRQTPTPSFMARRKSCRGGYTREFELAEAGSIKQLAAGQEGTRTRRSTCWLLSKENSCNLPGEGNRYKTAQKFCVLCRAAGAAITLITL